MSRRAAIATIATAATLDVVGGLAFAHVEHLSVGLGLYWAVTTATTTGFGDVIPHTNAGHWIAVVVMLSVIPLVSATFSLLTSSLTAGHIGKSHHELRRRLEHIIEHHPDIPPLN